MRSMRIQNSERPRRRGHAVMEVALIAPWIFFLFVATLDFGFYSYWIQAVANASRAAAVAAHDGVPDPANYANNSDPDAFSNALDQRREIACRQVQNELRGVMGFDAVSGFCTAAPLTVNLQRLDSTTSPVSADGNPSVLVTVTWQTAPLIPVPGILNQFTLRRDTELRIQ